MNELVFRSDKGNPVTTSLLVAEKFEKEHFNVIRDIENLKKDVLNFEGMFFESTYSDSYGRPQRMYIMNRDGFTLLAMGFTGKKAMNFKLEYIQQFNQMERQLKELTSSNFQIPQNFADALRLAASKVDENEKLQLKIEQQAPAVLFTASVEGAKTNILIGDLAKMICQAGVDIGQNRLYEWLVENDYLICRKRWSKKHEKYFNDYMPTQKAADLKVFHVKPTTVSTSTGTYIRHAVKVTGKGQTYFINKFLSKKDHD